MLFYHSAFVLLTCRLCHAGHTHRPGDWNQNVSTGSQRGLSWKGQFLEVSNACTLESISPGTFFLQKLHRDHAVCLYGWCSKMALQMCSLEVIHVTGTFLLQHVSWCQSQREGTQRITKVAAVNLKRRKLLEMKTL